MQVMLIADNDKRTSELSNAALRITQDQQYQYIEK